MVAGFYPGSSVGGQVRPRPPPADHRLAGATAGAQRANIAFRDETGISDHLQVSEAGSTFGSQVITEEYGVCDNQPQGLEGP